MQYDLFLNETETMREEIQKIKDSTDRVRRSLFAKNGELGKEILKLREELEVLKHYVGYKPKQTEIVELLQYVQ